MELSVIVIRLYSVIRRINHPDEKTNPDSLRSLVIDCSDCVFIFFRVAGLVLVLDVAQSVEDSVSKLFITHIYYYIIYYTLPFFVTLYIVFFEKTNKYLLNDKKYLLVW